MKCSNLFICDIPIALKQAVTVLLFLLIMEPISNILTFIHVSFVNICENSDKIDKIIIGKFVIWITPFKSYLLKSYYTLFLLLILNFLKKWPKSSLNHELYLNPLIY